MLDLIRCRGRGSKLAALTLAALTIFALVLVATPASAADPVDISNFSPNDTEIDATGDAEAVVMSDRFDGSNSTFRLNTVATQDTASVDWYFCPDTYAGTDPTLGGSGCTLAGTDSSGVTPPGPGTDGTDKTFEAEFDVPDDGSHDWVAWACTQTPKTDANCAQEKEEDVQFDDASTGTPASQSTSGFITAPANGSGQGGDSYDLFATTSPDVDAVLFCSRETADADTDPSGPASCDDDHNFGSPINPPAQQSQFKLWGETLDTGAHCVPCENGWVLFESGGGVTNSLPPGSDNCSGDGFDCQLDTVYITESPSEPTSVKLAFPDYGEPSTTPNDCDEPEAVQTASDTPGQLFEVQGCIFDQSNSPLTDVEEWAFQATPVDPDSNTTDTLGFDGTGSDEGDENDTNGDSFFEQVDGDPTDAGSLAQQAVDLDTGGTYTITFCRDSDDNADDFAAPQSATPCSGEALSATGTLNLTPEADHVHVKKQATEGPQCHTGSSSTTAPAGSTVNLVGCALGTVAGPGATLEQPAPNTHVLWIVNPANQPQDPGQIVTQENTTDTAGKADATVTSGGGSAEKTSTIRFCIDEFPAAGGANAGNGICDAFEVGRQPDPALQADFQINWTAAATQPGDCPNGVKKKTGTSGDDTLSGGPDCDKLLGKKGEDKLKGKGGNDVLVGGPGDDILIGGPGNDKCRGGAGQDKLKKC